MRALATRYGVSPTTVQKWRKRSTTTDAQMGPKERRSTVLTSEEEAMIVASRRHTLLSLDDCLYGLQPTIPHLTRSSLHRCLERHGIRRGSAGRPRPSDRYRYDPPATQDCRSAFSLATMSATILSSNDWGKSTPESRHVAPARRICTP